MKFTIPLTPITKKNHQQIIQVKGRPCVIPSKQYRQYEKDCEPYMPKGDTYDCRVNVKALYYMPTHRRVDLTNLHESLHDIMTKYKVIADDNCNIIASTDGSQVLYDKENPRTEVEINELDTSTNNIL